MTRLKRFGAHQLLYCFSGSTAASKHRRSRSKRSAAQSGRSSKTPTCSTPTANGSTSSRTTCEESSPPRPSSTGCHPTSLRCSWVTRTSTPLWATRPSIQRRRSTDIEPSSRAAAPCARARNIAYRPMPNGMISSAISSVGRSRSANAAGHTARVASTSTAASLNSLTMPIPASPERTLMPMCAWHRPVDVHQGTRCQPPVAPLAQHRRPELE